MDGPAEVPMLAIALARFARRLESQHPAVWDALHSTPESGPAAPGARRRKVAGRVAYYLYSRGYRTLKDPAIHGLGDRACSAHAIFLLYTVVAAALVLALVRFAR